MKAGQQLSVNGVEVALFPLEHLRQTCGENEGAHKGIKAQDFSTKGVVDIAYAPTACKVVLKVKAFSGVVYESVDPVRCADGSTDYIHWGMKHSNDISWLSVGQVFAQGGKIYTEGGADRYGNPGVHPSHIHLVAGKGKFTGEHRNDQGKFQLNTECSLSDIFLVNDTDIIDARGVEWKTYEPVAKEPTEVVAEEPATTPVEPIPSPSSDETEQVDTIPVIPLEPIKPKPAPNAKWWARLILRILEWILSKWGKK